MTDVAVYEATAAGAMTAVAAAEAAAATVLDQVDARPQADVVALGSYNINVREIERAWRYLPGYARTPAVFNEGYLSVAVPPYPIPYRSLTPRRDDAEDLLVPVCLSASHTAFGSVRMEPTLDVDVGALQGALCDGGQVLSP